jgi:hypothetical protein
MLVTVKRLLNSRNTFGLYIHRESGRLIGLCAELRTIIEGSTLEEILTKAKVLIAGTATGSAPPKPRISVRVSPLLADLGKRSPCPPATIGIKREPALASPPVRT